MKERERERERDRDRDRDRDRETDRQRQTETDRQTQTERKTERQTTRDREAEREYCQTRVDYAIVLITSVKSHICSNVLFILFCSVISLFPDFDNLLQSR